MEVCRVCLATGPDKDVHQLKTSKKEGYKSPAEIMEFCLGIQIENDSKITEKLCTKCFSKIRSFYKFKATALKNDSHLKSMSLTIQIKIEQLHEEAEVAKNIESDNENYEAEALTNEIKEEYEFEFQKDDLDSDDEILSRLKSDELILEIPHTTELKEVSLTPEIKSENANIDENKLNVPKKRRKRTKLSTKKSKSGTKSGINNKTKGVRMKSKGDSQYGQGICDTCGKFVKDLKEHFQTHVPKHLRMVIKCKDKDCDKLFACVGARNKHYKIKHLGLKSRCTICSKVVTCISVHMKTMHEPEKMTNVCVLCEKRFISATALDVHMRCHNKQRPFTCEQCGNMYKQENVLRNHIKAVHLKEKSHMCEFCFKRFFKKVHLQNHLRIHTKEKPYECVECGAKFATRTTLTNHIKTHNSNKDFHCPLCSMSFVRACYLRVHMNTHTKAKKYPCKYCGVTFGRSDHRKRHEFTAHEKNHPQGNSKKRNMAAIQNGGSANEENCDNISVETVDDIQGFDVSSADSTGTV